MRKPQEYKIKGTHKITNKERWFTTKAYSFEDAVKDLIKRYIDFEFPEID